MKNTQDMMAYRISSAVQAPTLKPEATLTNLQEALDDRNKQVTQLQKQLAQGEKHLKEEKRRHGDELSEYIEKANAEKDKLETKFEHSQTELGEFKSIFSCNLKTYVQLHGSTIILSRKLIKCH